jgi:hypothetical protein
MMSRNSQPTIDPAAKKDPTARQRPGHEQQHTGNHDKPAAERGGADRHGGTRDGAENVE